MTLMSESVALTREVLGVDHAFILEWLPDPESMRLVAASSRSGAATPGREVPADEYPTATRTVRSARPVLRDISGDRFLEENDIRSTVHVPVAGPGGLFGVLMAGSTRPRSFGHADADLLLAVGNVLWSALTRAGAQEEIEMQARLLDEVGVSVHMVDMAGNIIRWSPGAAGLFGWSEREALGKNIIDLSIPASERSSARATLAEIVEQGRWSGEWCIRTKDGRLVPTLVNASIHRDVNGEGTGIIAVAIDLSERKAMEESRVKMEQQLRQSQKMEAVGRLAGGIAHDFNNILAVIINYAGFLRDQFQPNDPRLEDVEEIADAGERAARLIRQLLTFSRKEITKPQVVDLNVVLADMEKLLRRTLGEDVRLRFDPGKHLWRSKIDPSQIEQVLLNLAVNTRDAMPEGGHLVIETSNVLADEAMSAALEGFTPGEYACLTVSDTGEGMPEEIRSQIFEPFFTTKPRGEGTGLGLASVYGIVKRAGGYISVYSEPGIGTTFRVYLPRAKEAAAPIGRGLEVDARGGSETVLVVEDEAPVRKLVQRILEKAGYRVLLAESGPRAVEVAAGLEGGIDLLLTDVIMPEMSGRTLSEHLRGAGMSFTTLYMSGYTDEIVARRGELAEGELFVQKPFSADGLLKKVRQVLDTD